MAPRAVPTLTAIQTTIGGVHCGWRSGRCEGFEMREDDGMLTWVQVFQAQWYTDVSVVGVERHRDMQGVNMCLWIYLWLYIFRCVWG